MDQNHKGNDSTNPTTETFSYQLIIKERHLDSFGHVNNATYFEIFEEARWEFLYARGFDYHSIQQLAVGPVVLESTVKFIKELRLRQTITIESRILSYENKIGAMQQEILDEQNNLCCHAIFKFGLFDMKARKLIAPSAMWLHAIGYNQ